MLVDLDKLAIERADEYLHDLFGKHLMRNLYAKWMSEGVAQYNAGVPLHRVLPEHRVGWKTAQRTLAEVEEVLHGNS